MAMRLLVVDVEMRHGKLICDGLVSNRYMAVGSIHNLSGGNAMIRLLRPDLMVVICETPDKDLVNFVRTVFEDGPMGVVVFTKRSDENTTRMLIRMGVASVVIDGIDKTRIEYILDVAVERFRAQQAVMTDLLKMKSQLNERKIIERAKGRLMQTKGLSEEQAFGVLRSSAMATHSKIVDVAREVLQRY